MADENPYVALAADVDTHDVGGPSSVAGLVNESVRIIVRASSFSAFAATLTGSMLILLLPGPRPSPLLMLTLDAIQFGGAMAFFCLLACVMTSHFESKRSLWPAVTVNVASIAMAILTPA